MKPTGDLQSLTLGCVVPIVLTVPGLAILGLFTTIREWPVGLALGAAFIVSVLLASLTQLPALYRWSRFAAYCLALFVLISLVSGMCTWAWERAVATGPLGTAGYVAPLLVYLTWAWLSRLSPYPGNISLELGDIPAYFRAADNLCQGRGFQEDYYIGDFYHGIYHYVIGQPIPALTISFFQRLCGRNILSLGLANSWAGAILCMAAADVASRSGLGIYATSLLFLAIPCHWLHFGLGAHTLSGPLAFIVIGGLAAEGLLQSAPGWGVFLAALALMFWYRPETRLLAALCPASLTTLWVWNNTGPEVHKWSSPHLNRTPC